jgi:hypothetical protein
MPSRTARRLRPVTEQARHSRHRVLTTAYIDTRKSCPKGALCSCSRLDDQAAANARSLSLRERRLAIKPTPAKPRIIIAQVGGSGTAMSKRNVKRRYFFGCASAASANLSHSRATFSQTALSCGLVIFSAISAASFARLRQLAAVSIPFIDREVSPVA